MVFFSEQGSNQYIQKISSPITSISEMALGRKLTEEAEDDQKKKKQKVGFYKLFTHADRVDVALMILGTIGAIASGSSQPISTLAFSRLVNSIGQTDQSQLLDEVSKVALKIFFIAIAAAVAGYLQAFCWTVTGQRQSSRIRTLYLKALLRQEIAFFDTKMTSGEVITTISGDAILVHEAMGLKVGQFIEYTSMFVSAFTVALFRGWFLSVVLLLCVPPLALVGGSLALITSKISAHGQLAYAEAGNVVEQTLRAIRTVASFCGEKRAVVKYDEKLRKAYMATVHQGLVSGLGMGLMLFTSFACYGFAIWYGCRLIREKGYSGGDVMNVIIAIMIAGSSLAQMSPCINTFSASQAAAVKLFETIDRQPLINSSEKTGIAPENLEGEIEFRDVHFRYPSRPDVKIFDGFSLQVRKGRTLALVGQSGSGKSSIVSLLQRFYDPEAGKILIDGVDLKHYQLEYIRRKMGLVSQEPVLFTTSIKENILYAKPDATEKEIRTAVELANCAEFIDKLPNGIHTMVGENGIQLSGGEKQRICIARAVIKDPKILLLDEATSALDMASESNVQYALEKVMPNRTTIVVAHRLSTVKNAHLIAVLHAGKLVEQGTHNDLIQDPNGAYHQLVRMQERGAEERETGKEEHAEDQIDSPLKTDKYFTSRASSKRVSPSFEHLSVEFDLYRESSKKNENTVEGSKTDASNEKKSTIKRLARLNRTELPALLVGSLAAATHGVAYPVFGLLLATAFGIFTKPPNELQKDSKFWALMFISVGSVVLIAAPIQNFMFGISGGKLVKRVRSLMFERVIHQEISWFDDKANSSGAIGARLSTDASMLRNLVVDTLSLAVQNFATALAGLLIAFSINWKIALAIVVVVPLMLIEGFIRMKLVQDGNNKVLYEEATQVANDAIGGIRTVASFCCEEKFMENYQRKCKTPMKQGIWNGNVGGISLGFANFVLFSIYSFSFYIGAVLTNHYQERFVQVFKVFFALQVSSIGISQSGNLLANFKKSKESADSIFEIVDQKPNIDSSSQDGLKLEYLNGDIRFHHVSFRYPTRPDMQIFSDFNIFISAGKTNALVGESGSGKSTVISLLQRFYDQDSGHIYLDGIDIREMNLSWLRQQMGLVSQEPILFNETIRDNITYGSNLGNSSEEEIIEAAKSANAHSFISALPQGYDTYVGERGTQLSGGQKQRVAIARVILKNPKILLLDEATSALDAESECLVMDALDRVRVNRTTIIVGHRLSAVKGADTITVVKNGVVAETGSHDVLIGISGGIYAGLVALSSAASN